MIVGATGNQTQNNGRMFITLKPLDERKASATEIIERLAPKLAQVEGRGAVPAARTGYQVGGRPTRTLFQYTLQDADLDELNNGRRRSTRS